MVNLKLRRIHRVVAAGFFAVLLSTVVAITPPLPQNAVAEDCRQASTLPIGSVLSARGEKVGRIITVQFTLRNQHWMFCDFGTCCFGNRDKIAFKPDISSNVTSADPDGGCNFNYVIEATNFTDDVVAGFKAKYNENVSVGNCSSPKRNVFKFIIPQRAIDGSAIVYSGPFDIELINADDDGDPN